MAADPNGSRAPLSTSAAPAGRATTAAMSVPGGRSTQTISIAQTAPLRIDHLADNIANDTKALRRSLPDVAAEALELCSRSSADAAAMEKTLGRDPFISAQVISIANSALFAPKMPILGVRDAVVRIGLDALRDVVLMVVTNSTMFRVRGFEARVEGMRRTMLASAAAARQLAKALRVESEYGFLAGLLHNIGELVILERCVQEGIVTPEMMDNSIDGAIVRERILFHHARVGAAVCKAWKLPAGVIEAAEFHHDPSAGGKRRFAAMLIAGADAMGDHCMPGSQAPDPATAPAVQALNLTAEQIATIVKTVKAELPTLLSTGSTAQPR